MTKFEELMDIISNKKNKGKLEQENNDNNQLEVAGSESTKSPLISFGDDETDMSLTDQLYRSRHKPLMGERSSLWE